MQNKTADNVQIGDVVIYETKEREHWEITITDVSEDRHGCILIDGITVNGITLLGKLASHIVRYISHAKPPKIDCCKGIGIHTSDCIIENGLWYDRNTRTIYRNSTGQAFITLGEDIAKIMKEN